MRMADGEWAYLWIRNLSVAACEMRGCDIQQGLETVCGKANRLYFTWAMHTRTATRQFPDINTSTGRNSYETRLRLPSSQAFSEPQPHSSLIVSDTNHVSALPRFDCRKGQLMGNRIRLVGWQGMAGMAGMAKGFFLLHYLSTYSGRRSPHPLPF
jgi:hypothetical protein